MLARTPGWARNELLRVCGAIAEAKGFPLREVVLLANRNAARFLAPVKMAA